MGSFGHADCRPGLYKNFSHHARAYLVSMILNLGLISTTGMYYYNKTSTILTTSRVIYAINGEADQLEVRFFPTINKDWYLWTEKLNHVDIFWKNLKCWTRILAMILVLIFFYLEKNHWRNWIWHHCKHIKMLDRWTSKPNKKSSLFAHHCIHRKLHHNSWNFFYRIGLCNLCKTRFRSPNPKLG